MDQDLQALVSQLGVLVARSTAGAIGKRVQVARSARNAETRAQQLEEMISELLDERQELVQIAQGFEEALTSRRLSDGDIEYIINTVIPLFEKMVPEGDDAESQLDTVKSLISVETLTIMQVIGFDYKEAIGRPLTHIVQTMLLNKAGMLAVTAGEKVEGDGADE